MAQSTSARMRVLKFYRELRASRIGENELKLRIRNKLEKEGLGEYMLVSGPRRGLHFRINKQNKRLSKKKMLGMRKNLRLQPAILDMHVTWKIRDLARALLEKGISKREINRSLRPVIELQKVSRHRDILGLAML